MGINIDFAQILDQVEPRLRAVTNWREPLGPDKWTRIELLGHLLDSAANNHQRFVRALSEGSLVWPGYDQNAHVAVQLFAEADPGNLVTLVLSFNRHLAWLFTRFPEDKLAAECRIGDDAPMTLETLALDYIAHAEHHLRQLLGPAGIAWSGRPWPPFQG
ncbi:MAG: DinB family protein [Bryobacteraceae bacterium]|nr:DinB family protein [Bryobacteraceae bacterium]